LLYRCIKSGLIEPAKIEIGTFGRYLQWCRTTANTYSFERRGWRYGTDAVSRSQSDGDGLFLEFNICHPSVLSSNLGHYLIHVRLTSPTKFAYFHFLNRRLGALTIYPQSNCPFLQSFKFSQRCLLKPLLLFYLYFALYLPPVKSAPISHSFNVRQYYGQNLTCNSTNSSPSTLSNTSTPDSIKQDGLAAQKMNSEFATIKANNPCQHYF